MQLPKKTERNLMVKLSSDEKKAYNKMEKESQKWYLNYRSRHRHDMSKHYLTVSSRLITLRDAMSGGKYNAGTTPTAADTDVTENDAGEIDEEKPRRKAETVLSDFAFTSKLKVLLKELERTKNADPTSKSLVFSQYKTTLDWLKQELPKHGYQFRSLSGDMSMSKFKYEGPK
jgi:SNF2 family DNA or RNA helicase